MSVGVNFIRSVVVFVFSLLTFSAASAAGPKPEIYMDKGGVLRPAWDYAVGGYDPVAYFEIAEGAAPIMGSDAFVMEYKGVKWRFSSQANLEKFKANPERYRPQYGGYCAWALARGKLAKGDPKVWDVYEGRLYLNVTPRYQRQWLANVNRDIARANANWPGILSKR